MCSMCFQWYETCKTFLKFWHLIHKKNGLLKLLLRVKVIYTFLIVYLNEKLLLPLLYINFIDANYIFERDLIVIEIFWYIFIIDGTIVFKGNRKAAK